jgi:acyl-coenzyme A thioesterase PaaI-like protein
MIKIPAEIPEGFAPHFRKSPVTDPWEPIYSRCSEGRVEIGLFLAEAHCNSRGLIHGGVIAALADNAMGLSFHDVRARALGEAETKVGLVTVNLSIDFIATGKLGNWLQITPRVLRGGGATGFVDALITADDQIVARASAVFRALVKE